VRLGKDATDDEIVTAIKKIRDDDRLSFNNSKSCIQGVQKVLTGV
jgi:hypothetical protein